MGAVLLLVGNKTSLDSDDTSMQSRLSTSLGHTVTVRGLSDAVSVAGFDLLVVSRSTGFGTHPDYSGEDIPVVSLSRGSWPMFGWSTDAGSASGSGTTTLVPSGVSHPVHAGFTAEVVLLGAGSQWRLPSSPPASLETRWAYVGSTVLFTFEPSSALLSSKTATQRQAGWGINSSGDTAGFTSSGWAVFDAAVDWALGGVGSSQLSVPSGFTFVAATSARQLDGAWGPVSGAAIYRWEVEKYVAEAWSTFFTGTTASLAFQLTDTDGVDWATTYRARVRAEP